MVALNGALFVNARPAGHGRRGLLQGRPLDVAEIQDAHRLLEPLLGARVAPIAFAIALIAAGQASTITGTLAGQIVMEGFVQHPAAPAGPAAASPALWPSSPPW